MRHTLYNGVLTVPIGFGCDYRSKRFRVQRPKAVFRSDGHPKFPRARHRGVLVTSAALLDGEFTIRSSFELGCMMHGPSQTYDSDQPFCGFVAGDEAAHTLDWRRSRVDMAIGDLERCQLRGPFRQYQVRLLPTSLSYWWPQRKVCLCPGRETAGTATARRSRTRRETARGKHCYTEVQIESGPGAREGHQESKRGFRFC